MSDEQRGTTPRSGGQQHSTAPGTTVKQQRNTTRQREAGAASRAETRRRLVVAAHELFLERGYTATTVTAIAQRAGVSLQTLYLACGSKRELLRTVLGQALSGTSGGIDAQYVPRLQAWMAAAAQPVAEPERSLRAFAHVFRTIAERAAPWWRVYHDAQATDPEIAEDWARLTALRRATTASLLDGLAPDLLRPGLTRERAIDTVWAVASPETCDLLVRHAGYTLEAYESWIAETIIAVLSSP